MDDTQRRALRRARGLGLTGAGALVSAAAFFLFWGFVYIGMLFSEVGTHDEGGVIVLVGAIAIACGLALSAWASRTLVASRMLRWGWAILLPLAVSIAWASAAIAAPLPAESIRAVGALFAPWPLLVAMGLTVPIGIALGLVYLGLRIGYALRSRQVLSSAEQG